MVDFGCECCRGQELWFNRTQLVSQFGFSDQRLRQIEENAFREQKEKETRENAEELWKYLDFTDIKDFNMLPDGAFEVVNFEFDSQCEHFTEDNESLCCDSIQKDHR